MRLLSEFVHRCLSPFMAGASMAAITVVEEPSVMALLMALTLVFAFMSLPVGGRMIRRAAGTDRET